MEQEKDLDALENKVGQLERVRQKQADHIAGLRDNLHSTVSEMDVKRNTCNSTIQNMTSELRTTKTALTEAQSREQQVSDRSVEQSCKSGKNHYLFVCVFIVASGLATSLGSYAGFGCEHIGCTRL